jgi:PASTA domain-containing protein
MSSVITAPAAGTTIPTLGVLVPQVIGRTPAQARTAMRAAGRPSGAHEHDPQVPNAVMVAQEPPVGALVPPNSPVGFRTRSDAGPTARPAGCGWATAQPQLYHPLTVAMTMPRPVNLPVWLEAGPGRRVLVLDRATASGM